MSDENAPVPSVRFLRRTLLIVGLSCVSATALALWLLPMLRREPDDSEFRAFCALDTYARAQIAQYRAAKGRGEFVANVEALARVGCLSTDMALAHGPQGKPLNGYLFLELKTISGQPIDWTKDFALCATPTRYHGARRRTLIVKSDKIVWAKDLGRAEFVTEFPADPAREGWKVVE